MYFNIITLCRVLGAFKLEALHTIRLQIVNYHRHLIFRGQKVKPKLNTSTSYLSVDNNLLKKVTVINLLLVVIFLLSCFLTQFCIFCNVWWEQTLCKRTNRQKIKPFTTIPLCEKRKNSLFCTYFSWMRKKLIHLPFSLEWNCLTGLTNLMLCPPMSLLQDWVVIWMKIQIILVCFSIF